MRPTHNAASVGGCDVFRVQAARTPVGRTWVLVVVFLGLATVATFWPLLKCDFIVIDDADYVTSNPHVAAGLSLSGVRWAFTTFHSSNWHPLTWLSLMLDVSIAGISPAWLHGVNLALHTFNVILVFAVLRKLTATIWLSALAAALFGLHPLRVESVAWIAERKDLLAMSFGLLSLLAHLQRVGSTPQSSACKKWKIIAMFCYGLSLLSKPTLVTLPFVLLLLDYWPLGRLTANGASIRSLLSEKVGYFLLSFGSCVIALLAQHHGGAIQSLQDLSFTTRFANSFVSYLRYLEKTFYPVGLAIPYPFSEACPWRLVVLAMVILGGSLLLTWRFRRRFPGVWIGLCIFFGALVPMIGLVQVGGQAMADRYTYWPHFGLALALIGLVSSLDQKPKGIALVVGPFLLICECTSTRTQLRHWRNSETLLTHTLAVTSNNALAHYFLGIHYNSLGNTVDAVSQFEEALTITPEFAWAREKLATTLLTQGKAEAALEHCQRLTETNPRWAIGFNNYGAALAQLGQIGEAIRQYEKAIELDANCAQAHYNLALALTEQGRLAPAIQHFNAALRTDPRAEIFHNLGRALAKAGNLTAAADAYREAFALDPSQIESLVNLGNLSLQQHQPAEALKHYQRALALASNNPVIMNNLGQAFAALGSYQAAKTNFQFVLERSPNFDQVRLNLAKVYIQQTQYVAALHEFNTLLANQSNNPLILAEMAACLDALGDTNAARELRFRAQDLNSKQGTLLQERGIGTHPVGAGRQETQR